MLIVIIPIIRTILFLLPTGYWAKMNSCGRNILYFYIIFALRYSVLNACNFQPDSSVRCELVLSERCRYLGNNHNATTFPNIYGHVSQREVEQFLDQTLLLHLVDLDCSPYTAHLICLAVYPLCYHRQFEKVEPCREMCVDVRDSCAAVLSHIAWPEALNCDRFPPFGTEICISNRDSNCGLISSVTVTTFEPTTREVVTASPGEPNCTGHLLPLGKNSKTSFGGRKDCVESCHGVYFEQHQNMLLTICTTSLSMINFVVSVFTFLTFVLNFKSIHRLESPLYYISLCYAFLGLANTISMALGRDSLICNPKLQNHFNQSALVVEGLTHPLCAILFSIAYYFTLCSWIWWCALTLQWFLFNIREKEISLYLTICLHVIAWGTPFLFLMIALGIGGFSGNPVTQVCWIHKDYEIPFIIIPLAASLLFCSLLVLIRFMCVLSPQNKRLQYLEEGNRNPQSSAINVLSLFKISLYIILFLSVMGVLFCSYFYDFWYRVAWEKIYFMCSSKTSLQTCNMLPKSSKPSLPVYLSQVSASVCMGFLSVMWVLREDLMKAWKKTCCVFCAWRRPRNLEFEVGTHEAPPGDSGITLKDIENCEETIN